MGCNLLRPSVIWHCWSGYETGKNESRKWAIMCQ